MCEKLLRPRGRGAPAAPSRGSWRRAARAPARQQAVERGEGERAREREWERGRRWQKERAAPLILTSTRRGQISRRSRADLGGGRASSSGGEKRSITSSISSTQTSVPSPARSSAYAVPPPRSGPEHRRIHARRRASARSAYCGSSGSAAERQRSSSNRSSSRSERVSSGGAIPAGGERRSARAWHSSSCTRRAAGEAAQRPHSRLVRHLPQGGVVVGSGERQTQQWLLKAVSLQTAAAGNARTTSVPALRRRTAKTPRPARSVSRTSIISGRTDGLGAALASTDHALLFT